MIGHSIRVDNQLKSGIAIFSAEDQPMLERFHQDATFFGLDWQKYFSVKGIRAEDVWPPSIAHQSLMNAQLYPLAEDVTGWRDLLWLQDVSGNESTPSRLESWRVS